MKKAFFFSFLFLRPLTALSERDLDMRGFLE